MKFAIRVSLLFTLRDDMSTLVAFAMLVLTSVLQISANNPPPAQNADNPQLTRLAIEAGHAHARKDLPALEQLTADDYSQIDMRGGLLNRSQWLEYVKNRKSELAVETDDVRISNYGETSVVTGHWTYTLKSPGGDKITYSRWNSVWTRDSGGWKRHNFQNTYINPNADRCLLDQKP
jgi:ketosteroid isomerase-like protein